MKINLSTKLDFFLKTLATILVDKRKPLSDDLRKIGTGSIAIAVVAAIVGADKINATESWVIFLFGVTVWLIGLSLNPIEIKEE